MHHKTEADRQSSPNKEEEGVQPRRGACSGLGGPTLQAELKSTPSSSSLGGSPVTRHSLIGTLDASSTGLPLPRS